MTEKEIVLETKTARIVRYENGVKMILYPIVGYGNHHGWELRVIDDTVELIKFCYGWATGPCRGMDDCITVASITDEPFANEVRKLIKEVKTIDDFDKLIMLVEQRQQELDAKVQEKFNELVEAFENLVSEYEEIERIKELLKDKEELRKLVEDFIEQYISDC